MSRTYQIWGEAESQLVADPKISSFDLFQTEWKKLRERGLLNDGDKPRSVIQWRNKRSEHRLPAIVSDTPMARNLSLAARIEDSPRAPRTIGASIKCDSILILPDVHIPRQDAPFINRAIDLAESWVIETCLLAGDFINCDDFSSHPTTATDDTDPLSVEMAESERAMQVLQNKFKRVFHMQGNHEIRAMRSSVLGTFFYEKFWQHGNLVVTDFEWVELRYKEDVWRITHPRRGRSTPLSFGRQLASKKQCNVVVAHQHLLAQGHDASGKFWCIDSGMCADPSRIPYALKTDGTSSEMQQGCVVLYGVKDKLQPYLLYPDMDWDAMSRLYKRST